MQTKLQRIDDLMRNTKDRKYADGDYARLASELDDQLGSFKDENTLLKERVRKLKTIHHGLTAQIERGGITAGLATGGFPKKQPRGTSSKGPRRPTTATTKRASVGPANNAHNTSGYISNASATMGGISQSGAVTKEYTA